jgi:uncharacterized protein YbjQ (UPF0145 family)
MLTTTTFSLAGYEISEELGVVRGIIVRSPTIGQNILGGLKSIVGGNIGAFTDMCESARQHAFDQMVAHAQQLGANAIIGIRYDGSDLGQSTGTEVLCYGTAVKVMRSMPH